MRHREEEWIEIEEGIEDGIDDVLEKEIELEESLSLEDEEEFFKEDEKFVLGEILKIKGGMDGCD